MTDTGKLTAVPAADVKQASKAMLQQKLYAVFTTPTDGLEAVFANLEAHLEFQVTLEKQGVLYSAGPLWTDDEQHWEGEGMVIIRAASAAEAVAIAEQDPMHQTGARRFRVRPWMINEGSITLRLGYSDQTFSIA